MIDIWHDAERIYFEHGVVLLRVDESNWQCESAVRQYSTSPNEIIHQFRLRPILAKYRTTPDFPYSMVFPSHTGKALNVQLSELQQLIYKEKNSAYFIATQSLFFLLTAAIYHCERIAEQYAASLAQMIKFPNPKNADRIVTACYEGFFEFDALVTGVIRAVDSTRYIIWREYGAKGSVPSSFCRTIDNCINLPDTLKQLSESLWDKRLAHAKEYRDCIQHYVAVGSSSWAMMTRVGELIWTLLLRIPDNPEAKSAKKFTYKLDLDAMTYAWELIGDLFTLTNCVIHSVLEKNKEAKKSI